MASRLDPPHLWQPDSEPLDLRSGIVDGAIIRDQDLQWTIGLCCDRPNCVSNETPRIESGDDHGNEWIAHTASSSAERPAIKVANEVARHHDRAASFDERSAKVIDGRERIQWNRAGTLAARAISAKQDRS